MTVFLTHSAGFIGANILEKLTSKNVKVRSLVRSKEKVGEFIKGLLYKDHIANIEFVVGDITMPGSYSEYLDGIDVVINLSSVIHTRPYANISRESYSYMVTKDIVEMSIKRGVKKFIHLSPIGALTSAKSSCLFSKYKAERYVIESFENWFVVRVPIVIIGHGGEFTRFLATGIRSGVVLIAGDGEYSLRPISITTLSEFVSYLVTESKVEKREFNIVGPREYKYNEFVDIFASILGKKRYLKVYLPFAFARLVLGTLDSLNIYPGILEQVEILSRGNINLFDTTDKLPVRNIPVEEEIRKLRRR